MTFVLQVLHFQSALQKCLSFTEHRKKVAGGSRYQAIENSSTVWLCIKGTACPENARDKLHMKYLYLHIMGVGCVIRRIDRSRDSTSSPSWYCGRESSSCTALHFRRRTLDRGWAFGMTIKCYMTVNFVSILKEIVLMDIRALLSHNQCHRAWIKASLLSGTKLLTSWQVSGGRSWPGYCY